MTDQPPTLQAPNSSRGQNPDRMSYDFGEIGPTFSGTEGLTCLQFIRAIRMQAIESGKQRDDQWLADDVSIRFDGDALAWFEDLDPKIQRDWNHLRPAILARYAAPRGEKPVESQYQMEGDVIPFMGKDKEEGRQFVRSIRLRAHANGKANDSKWMCEAAYPFFSGKALDWYASLSNDIRGDWARLERALLLDFPFSPALTTVPARVRVDDWYTVVSSSPALLSLSSQAEWLAQARERRKMYNETKDLSTP
ncbi:hypothetical protein M407DRAFT_27795, partial [Tulasnella calospora MUT 4182]